MWLKNDTHSSRASIQKKPTVSCRSVNIIWRLSALGKCLLGGLDDDRRNLIGIAIGSRAPVLKTALPAVLDGSHRDTDGSSTIGHAVAKLVDRLRLVKAG